MQRFTTRENEHEIRPLRFRLLYILAPVLLIAFYYLSGSISSSTLERQQESLQKALDRDIVHCYAVEGYYPPSLDYLIDHYGLTYDKNSFYVDYRPIGSNIRPSVTIIRK